MYKYILIAAFCAGCITSESEKLFEDKCIAVFTDIFRVQEIREVSRKDFDITLNYRKAGKVSDSVYDSEFNRWIEKENELATISNGLYEKARTEGCFVEGSGLANE